MNRFFIIFLGSAFLHYKSVNAQKTITMSSVGVITVLPNIASFSINISCLRKNSKLSKDCLADKSDRLNTQLLNLGISKNDILTTDLQMYKDYKWSQNTQVFQGYKSLITVYVTVRELGNLDATYTQLFENQNLEVGGLSYAHSNLDSLKNEAYLKALEKSRILADKLLEKLPQNKKEIISISNFRDLGHFGEYRGGTPKLKVSALQDANAQPRLVVNKGNITVKSHLFVQFKIE